MSRRRSRTGEETGILIYLYLAPVPSTRPQCDPVVGARLKYFAQAWSDACCSPWSVDILKRCYRVAFHTKPGLSQRPIFSPPANLVNRLALEEEIRSMLLKCALEPVRELNTPGYYSLLVLVPKKIGGWRPVIDMSSLNRLNTPHAIRLALVNSYWVMSLHLKTRTSISPSIPTRSISDWPTGIRFCSSSRCRSGSALPLGCSLG